MEQFACKTTIVSGMGAVRALAQLNAKRLMLVSDPFFYENGTAARVADAAAAPVWEVFHEISPDPSVELAAQGAAAVRAFRPDVIVALGGGSAIDCAKAMAYFSGCEARFAAIPTTSGSGSEVTDFAILTHNGVKHPLIDEKLRPELAILDGELLAELPPALIADTGFDVLCHALEAYVASGAGKISDALAADAFCTAYALLPASFRGEREVRLAVHQAAAMAGMAFSQAGLGVCHALAHSLGGALHLPHGRLNAILLPEVVACNAAAASEKYAALARLAGLGGTASIAGRTLKNALLRLRRQLQLPGTLAEAGIAPALVRQKGAEIVRAAMEDPCCGSNPVPVTEQLLGRMLEAVTGNG